MRYLLLLLGLSAAVRAQTQAIVFPVGDAVAVTIPVLSSKKADETTTTFLERIRSEDCGNPTTWVFTSLEALPSDRYWRDAWEWSGTPTVNVSRTLAEDIQYDYVESAAASAYTSYQAVYVQADIDEDTDKVSETAAILTTLETLADDTDFSTTAAPTLNALKDIWPNPLEPRD